MFFSFSLFRFFSSRVIYIGFFLFFMFISTDYLYLKALEWYFHWHFFSGGFFRWSGLGLHITWFNLAYIPGVGKVWCGFFAFCYFFSLSPVCF